MAKIPDDAVIGFKENIKFTNDRTLTTEELADAISKYDSAFELWFKDGVECKAMAPGTKWRHGHVKLTFEFIPDETTT